MADVTWVPPLGAGCFGLVVGWITYRTLRRNAAPVGLQDIATVIGAVAGGAVVAIYDEPVMFGAYAIGLAGGFFGYIWEAGRRYRRKVAEADEAGKPRPPEEEDPDTWLGGGR